MGDTTIITLCDQLSKAIQDYYRALNCDYNYTYDTTIDSYLLNKIEILKNSNICNYQNSNINTIDSSLIPIIIDNNIIKDITEIINCIKNIIKTSRTNISNELCKLVPNYIFNPKLNFTYNIPIKYTIDDIIGYNIYLHLYSINSTNTEYVKELIKKYNSSIYISILRNTNLSEHNYILQNVKIKFNQININTNLYIVIQPILNKYKTIDICINSCFNNLHPELIKSINFVCEAAKNICSKTGEGSDIDIYSIYNNINRTLFNSIIDLCKLIKELKYATELINNSNDIYNLIIFLQIVSLSIYNNFINKIYNKDFFNFIQKTYKTNEYIVNNTINSNSLKIIAHQNFIKNINNDYIKLHFECILAIIDENTESYLKFNDINNYIAIISLVFGSYNDYLFSLD